MGWKGSNGKRGAAGKGTAAALAASCSLVFLAGWAWPRETSSVLLVCLLAALAACGIALAAAVCRLRANEARKMEDAQKMLQYQRLLTEATRGLYESIYEVDVTHNCAVGDATRQYFESLGVPADAPFDQALRAIADKQIAPEFARGYLDTFLPEHVLAAFEQGIDRLEYDFRITVDGKAYYWMRILARLFFWAEDSSVRMIVYRQNIDKEKRRERLLVEETQRDSLTGLYNRKTTEERIRRSLLREPSVRRAFLMTDIDNFKRINDTLGHAFGDEVILAAAGLLERGGGQGAIAGRVGGDEFALFFPVADRRAAAEKAAAISASLYREIAAGGECCRISASMGVALYPDDGRDFDTLYRKADEALYRIKNAEKNGFAMADEAAPLPPEEKTRMELEKIASFQVDHTCLVPGLYLSRTDGGVVTYDLRFVKPNTPPFLETAVMHTIEHLAATYVRSSPHKEGVIYFGPMGCRTGFYFLSRGLSHETVIALMRGAMAFIASFEGEVPGASAVECGNYLEHDLPAARRWAAAMAAVLADWTPARLAYPSAGIK